MTVVCTSAPTMTLSITVMVSKLFTTWKVRPMPRWQRSAAGNQIEQRRFAGAVGADQAHDLAAADRNGDVAVRDQATETLPDAAGFQQRRHRTASLRRRENSPTKPSGDRKS